MGAITFVEREAAAYDEAAVSRHLSALSWEPVVSGSVPAPAAVAGVAPSPAGTPSQLAQWPCQIKLVPVCAPYFQGADVLVAADCTAFACADFHRLLMAGRVTLVGCPKLDAVDYAEKLGAVLAANDVRSVTVARMEVPCCGGLEQAVRRAVAASGKDIPLSVITVSRDGRIL